MTPAPAVHTETPDKTVIATVPVHAPAAARPAPETIMGRAGGTAWAG